MTTPTNHLDDETLSAHLDGITDASAQSHLAGCAACRDRLAAFEAVAAAVGRPAPVLDEAITDRLITTALAAGAVDELAPVVPLRRGRPTGLMWVAGVAAALTLLLGVATAVSRAGRHGTAVASRSAIAPTTVAEATTGGQAFDNAAGAVSGGDLGDQSDPEAVASFARSAMGERPAGDAAAPLAAGATAKSSAAAGAQTTVTTVPASPQCTDQARAEGGPGLGNLVYFATLRWRGEPAEFLAFANRQGYVMARGSCAVLAAPHF